MIQARSGGLAAAACAALLMLIACAREGQDEMSWARAALERNHSLEVIATDRQSRTFTVRLKESGELRMVRADEIVGSAAPPATAAGTASPAQAPPPASTAATAAAAIAAPTGAGAAEEVPSEEPPQAPGATPSSLVPQTAPPAETAPGHVISSGPGYTIKAAPPAANAAGGSAREGGVTSAAVEWRHEPIVCQGSRLLHIDNRNLVFDGDAVSAEDGCEIHITNTHISARGIGVLARAANVHIDNSLIEGDQGAIDASEGAQVYAASSHFRGLSRREDSAAFHDLGGNIWN